MPGRVWHISGLELVSSAAPAGHRWPRCFMPLQEQFLCHALGKLWRVGRGQAGTRHRFCCDVVARAPIRTLAV